MLIPRYWSRADTEASTPDGRRIPVTLWRGSRESAAEAQTLARGAAERVAARIRAGEGFPERYTYDGGERALREEVIRELPAPSGGEPENAVTRNAYGARILNSTRVCFVDVDLDAQPQRRDREPARAAAGDGVRPLVERALGMLGIRTGGVVSALLDTFLGGGGTASSAPAPAPAPAAAPDASADGALERLRRWSVAHPEWNVRVYRTSAGLRYLVTHALFSPGDRESEEAMRALGADPEYVRLCRARKSFRARLTPKPWRIGMEKPPHRFPYADPEEEREVRDWVRRYDAASGDRATCRFVEAIGSGAVHPEVEPILRLHDEETRAASGLPLA